MTLRTTVLDSGLTVVTERMADVRSLSVGFWVGTGSVDEDPPLCGASHFLEHLLFKGTNRRSAREIAEAVDRVGGDMNAFTTKEYTAFYLRVLSDDAELALDVLSDIVWDPAFRTDEVEAERQVILEEILMHGDEPADLVHDVFAQAMFPGHPLGRDVLGDESSIAAMPRDAIAAFHHEYYRPGNVVVAAAGSLDHDHIVSGVADRLWRPPGGSPPRRRAPVPGPLSGLRIERSTEQAHLVVGVPAPPRDSEDRHVMAIIDHVLGGGMSSRLFQSIREERGLAYSVYSYRLGFVGTGALAVYVGTAPGRVKEVLALVEAGLDSIAADGISEAELSAARSHLRGATALGLEDSGARMSRIGQHQLVHGRVATVEEIDARLAAITTSDVRRVAAQWLGGPRIVAAVGPSGPAEVAATA
jgi:predicted Zn-dependent peptidase